LAKVADLTPDAQNAHKGTERGGAMIEDSLRRFGAGRSIVIDKHGNVIAGNKTLEHAGSIGMENVIVVQTDGSKIVAVQRMDLDLKKDARAKELAVADNRTGQVSLEWGDFGILKWSTSAVCFGPPWAQQTSTLDLSVSLSLEAGVGLESQGGVIRADSSGI
jgi:hypothetical protein